MKTTVTKLDDGSTSVDYTHKGILLNRVIPTITKEDGSVDEAAIKLRIRHIGKALIEKIDMGLITKDSESMLQNVGPVKATKPELKNVD